MKKTYKFVKGNGNKKNSSPWGSSFEMTIKDCLGRKNADKVSPAGTSDFRYKGKNYDTKQNGSVIRYNPSSRYIKGSSRVIYSTHIAYEMYEDDEYIYITVDLANTEMFVLDRNEFVKFLLDNGLAKENKSRGTVNVQTSYNYKKDAYHGRTGHKIEAWAYEHDLGDDIIGDILAALED